MTPTTLHARLTFSFKGQTHELESTFDLDSCRTVDGGAPNFHQMLARQGGVDPYSYLYEVMESHDIVFSNATGSAALCCVDGQFDWAQFERQRQEDQDLHAVLQIAEHYLQVSDLDRQPTLLAALLAAYRAGRNAEKMAEKMAGTVARQG
jgi:hypothetical protein